MDDHERKGNALKAALAEHEGKKLTAKQRADLEWYQHREMERMTPLILTCITKKTYCEMSGRHRKVLLEQAERYGLPLGDKTVDLTKLVRAFHDFLAENKTDLTVEDVDLRKEKLRKEIDVLQRRAQILDGEINQQRSIYIERSELRKKLAWMVGRFHDLGERLVRVGGNECQVVLNDFLDELKAEMEAGHLAT